MAASSLNDYLTRSVSGVDLGEEEQKVYHDPTGKVADSRRERTVLEREVIARHDAAEALIEGLIEVHNDDPTKVYVPSALSGAIFCGHLVTDMDSIAGAIGAADLYQGTASRASEVNSETKFCLDYWKVPLPPPVEDVLVSMPEAGVCLVDHQQTSQLNPAIPSKRIVGVIDHHALQSETIVTEMPIFIDIRPWGSMSTIIAHGYLTAGHKPPQPIAGMLLCAIISDTLNLQGPTTTSFDKMMVAILAVIAGVEDINLLASQQFKAKSKELALLNAAQLCSGDCKVFKLAGPPELGVVYKVGFAVVETTDDGVILERKGELLPELVSGRKERGVDLLFLAVVNIVEMRAVLLLCGDGESALASKAFPDCSLQCPGVLDLGSRVSRKKEFVPPLTSACQSFVLADHVSKSSIDDRSSSGNSSTKRKATCVDDLPGDSKKAATGAAEAGGGGPGDVVGAQTGSESKRASSTNCSSHSAKDKEGDGFFISG